LDIEEFKSFEQVIKNANLDRVSLEKVLEVIEKYFQKFALDNQQVGQIVAQLAGVELQDKRSADLTMYAQLKEIEMQEKEMKMKEEEHTLQLQKLELEKQVQEKRKELINRQIRGYDDELLIDVLKVKISLMNAALSVDSLTAQQAIDNTKELANLVIRRVRTQ